MSGEYSPQLDSPGQPSTPNNERKSRSRSRSGTPASASPHSSRGRSQSPQSKSRSRSRSRSGSAASHASRKSGSHQSSPRSGSAASRKSGSRSRSRSNSAASQRSRAKSGSRQRSRSRSGSAASRTSQKSGSRGRSRSGSRRSRSGSAKSRSRSRSGSGSRRSRSGSRASRSRSRSGSRRKSGSRSRSRSRSGSRSRSHSGSRRSGSGSRSRSGSRRSRSGSHSRSRSGSKGSRSGSGSRSRSRSGSRRSRSGSRSRSRSRSGSRSGSAASNRSRSGSQSGSDDEMTVKKKKKGKKNKAGRISDASDNEGENELVAEIFGDSGDEGEGAKRKAEPEEGEPQQEQPSKKAKVDDSSDDDGPTSGGTSHMSDFDLMLARKKAERTGRKKRKDVDIINDTDDMIAEFLKEMKLKAEEDRELNKKKQAATKKLMYLNFVLPHLKKIDLKMAFLDQGVLNVICDWLSPLPDKSLPHLSIREEMLKLLEEFPSEALDQGMLKSSGIGRAVMYLYKHPKETKGNKIRAGKLIAKWSRPIFNLNTDYTTISKEERESKDYERFQSVRRAELAEKEAAAAASSSKKRKKNTQQDETNTAKPGEPGFVARARVPMPSIKDYVVRPKWNVDTEFSTKNAEKKKSSRLDKHVRAFQERKRRSKGQRSVTISIEGRKMAI